MTEADFRAAVEALSDPDAMIEITVPSGQVGYLKNTRIGHRGCIFVLWKTVHEVTKKDVTDMRKIAAGILRAAGAKVGTPELFGTKNQRDKLLRKHLGGGLG